VGAEDRSGRNLIRRSGGSIAYGLIRFEKSFELAEPETIRIFTDGRCMIRLDGVVAYQYDP
jgi:hypothetical protein